MDPIVLPLEEKISDLPKIINDLTLDSFLTKKGFVSIEGNISSCQGKINDLNGLINLINKPNINVMEIGFNAGHSAESFLRNKNVTLTSFDIGSHIYLLTAKEYIDLTFPNRHTLILGDSIKTIPDFINNNKTIKFDLIFIDGGHDYQTAYADLLNCRGLAHSETIVVMDDIVKNSLYEAGYTIGPTKAWDNLVKLNLLTEISHSTYCYGRGQSVGKYIIE